MKPPLVVCALALVAAGGAACGGSAAPTCTDPVSATTVDVKDFAFDPGCAAVPQDATLTLTDTGGAPHSFTVKGTDVNVTLNPGDTQTADLAGIAPGVYAVVCTYHPQMNGALKIG